MNRRSFLQSILLTATAPAIVRVGSLMPLIPRGPRGLTESMLEQALIDIMRATDERGLLISLPPTHLIVPTAWKTVAEELVAPLNEPFRGFNIPSSHIAVVAKPIPSSEWCIASSRGSETYTMTKEAVPRINGDFNKAPIKIEL